MFEVIARFSVRFRWLIIIVWIAAVPIISSTLPNINDVTKNDNSQFLPKNSQTEIASRLESNFQSKNTSSREILVVARENAPLSQADNDASQLIVNKVKKIDGVVGVRDGGASSDGKAHEYFVSLGDKAAGPGGLTLIKTIRNQIKTNSAGLQVHLTGEVSQAADAQNANNSGKSNTEIYNVI